MKIFYHLTIDRKNCTDLTSELSELKREFLFLRNSNSRLDSSVAQLGKKTLQVSPEIRLYLGPKKCPKAKRKIFYPIIPFRQPS